MSSQLRKCAGAQVDNDPRRPTLDQVAAAALSRIWARGTAPEYCELHALQFLSARALRLLPPALCQSQRETRLQHGRQARELGHESLLTVPTRDAYTLPDACFEGFRDAIHDKTLGGGAVSRTQLDREAVFFCVWMAVSRALLLRGGRVVDPSSCSGSRCRRSRSRWRHCGDRDTRA